MKQNPAHPHDRLQEEPFGPAPTITLVPSEAGGMMSRRPGTQPHWEFITAEEPSHLFVVFALSESLNCVSSLVIIDLAQEKANYYRNFIPCPIYCQRQHDSCQVGPVYWFTACSLSSLTFSLQQGLPSRDLPLVLNSASSTLYLPSCGLLQPGIFFASFSSGPFYWESCPVATDRCS